MLRMWHWSSLSTKSLSASCILAYQVIVIVCNSGFCYCVPLLLCEVCRALFTSFYLFIYLFIYVERSACLKQAPKRYILKLTSRGGMREKNITRMIYHPLLFEMRVKKLSRMSCRHSEATECIWSKTCKRLQERFLTGRNRTKHANLFQLFFLMHLSLLGRIIPWERA